MKVWLSTHSFLHKAPPLRYTFTDRAIQAECKMDAVDQLLRFPGKHVCGVAKAYTAVAIYILWMSLNKGMNR